METPTGDGKFEAAQRELLDDYMKTVGVANHQITSFNHFVHFDIPEIFRSEPDLVVRYPSGKTCVLKLYDPRLTRPYIVEDQIDGSTSFPGAGAGAGTGAGRGEKTPPCHPASPATATVPVPVPKKHPRDLVTRDPDGSAGEFPEHLITPNEARARDETYEGSLICSISVTCISETGELAHQQHFVQQRIARIPIMVRSSLCNIRTTPKHKLPSVRECENDPGGYFIVKGRERVLVSQIRTCDYNKMLVEKQKDHDTTVPVCSTRSMSDVTSHSVLIKCRFVQGDVVAFNIVYTREKEPVPLGILFMALGFTDLHAAERFLRGVPRGGNPDSERSGEKYIASMHRAVESAGVRSRLDALEYIGLLAIHPIPPDRRKEYAEQIVQMQMLPHIPLSSSDGDRAAYIGKMAAKLICTRLGAGRSAIRSHSATSARMSLDAIARDGVRAEDDRDDFRHKRIEPAGVLCSTLFRTVYKRYLKAVKQVLAKKTLFPPDIPAILAATNTLTQNIRMCFTTANWGAQNNSYFRVGVSQILNRLNYVATCSHLRRLATQVGRQGGKNKALRAVHPSQSFFICPLETPEGSTTGIVLNFALTTTMSIRVSPVLVEEHVRRFASSVFCQDYAALALPLSAIVMVNCRPIGSTTDPDSLVRKINDDKAKGKLHWCVTAAHDPHDCEVLIFCDEGRMMRPVFVVGAMQPFLEGSARTFQTCLDTGAVRYVDNNEINFAVVAISVSEIEKLGATFCEISPNCMFGIVAGCAPFSNHTQAPRNIYFSNMARQAIGFPVTTYQTRADTSGYVLENPQRPLVTTAFSKNLGFDDMPSASNAVVAVASFTGYNQEDGLILNKASIERGMFRITCRRTIVCTESNPSATSVQRILLPPPAIRRGTHDYSLLDDDGIIQSGVFVHKNTVVVGRVETTTFRDREDEQVDCSVIANSGEEGYVDRVILTTTHSDFRIVKVVIRSTRSPEIGDKFCSRSAQKGTCGMILPQEDMPFDRDGVCPDIIINPNCMPSRMTINQLMEMVVGKAKCFDGKDADATSFTVASGNKNSLIDDLCDRLGRTGQERHGWTVLTNGRTGRPFGARMFDVDRSPSTDTHSVVRDASDCGARSGSGSSSSTTDQTGLGASTKIFMGPACYYRLKHLVEEKVHARPHGPKQLLTRQPLSGRKRDGGLRFGEMERDASIVIGASSFLQDRLMKCSDPFSLRTCASCGNLAVSDDCRFCSSSDIRTVIVPYASRLLFAELQAMAIKVLIFPKEAK